MAKHRCLQITTVGMLIGRSYNLTPAEKWDEAPYTFVFHINTSLTTYYDTFFLKCANKFCGVG